MKKIFPLFLLLFLILSAGCTKKSTEPQLPPITHEGKNILACKINGEIMIVSGVPTSLNYFGTLFDFYNDSTINLIGSQETPNIHIAIEIKYKYSQSIYRLTDSLYPNRGYVEYAFNTSGNYKYRTDSLRTGHVSVLLYNGNILSGTFAFDAINNIGEVVHVTEGRFDIAKR